MAEKKISQDAQYDIAAAEFSDAIGRLAYAYERDPEKRKDCLLYTSPSPRDATLSRMPSSA